MEAGMAMVIAAMVDVPVVEMAVVVAVMVMAMVVMVMSVMVMMAMMPMAVVTMIGLCGGCRKGEQSSDREPSGDEYLLHGIPPYDRWQVHCVINADVAPKRERWATRAEDMPYSEV